jgi:hypothetical protein
VKSEYPPLFPAGFQQLEDGELDAVFVESFTPRERRKVLLARFRALLGVVRSWSIPCDVWIDGSFSTEKPEPEDIDALFVFDRKALNATPDNRRREIMAVLGRDAHTETKLRYSCDAFFVADDDDVMRSYWRGWFGFTRNEEPKGIPVMRVC